MKGLHMIFETHAHYDDEAFDEDRYALLESMAANGIGTVVNATASKRTVEKSLELAHKYPFVYTTIGVHPSDCAEMDEDELKWLEEKCADEKAVAVGEIGLDYHYDEPLPDVQKKWFEAQIELARRVKLPLIIHSRDAAKDTLDIMKALHTEEIGREGPLTSSHPTNLQHSEDENQPLSQSLDFTEISNIRTRD